MTITRNPSFFPARLSSYVPGMQFAADLQNNGIKRCSFGAPIAAAAAAVLNAQSIATAASTTSPLITTIDAEWGRNLTVVASGAATSTVTVNGRDYLQQRMTETLTLNGTTSVVGVKCFKYIDSIAWGATAATTINLGVGAVLGLPYKAVRVLTEELDNAIVATLGTLVGPVLTDPATATTGDPRGRYTPTSTLNGVAVLTATFLFDNSVNANNRGGLYGIAHFAT
jgi:hypothetical protein